MDIKALVIRATDSNPAWASPLAGSWKCHCAFLHGKLGSKLGKKIRLGSKCRMERAHLSSPGASAWKEPGSKQPSHL